MKRRKRLVVALMTALIMVLWAAIAHASALPEAVYPRSMKMSKATATLDNRFGKPGSVRLAVTTVPALGALTDPTVTWESADGAIASVDEKGLVTAVGEGKVKISASIKGKERDLTVASIVTVRAVRAKTFKIQWSGVLTLDHTEAAKGDHQLKWTVSPATATFQTPAWISSDERVAKVDAQGKVTAVGAGTATITGSVDGGRKSASCSVRVRDAGKLIPIVISAGGDLILGGDYRQKSDERFRSYLTGKGAHYPDYGYTLRNLRSLFSTDDLTIVNLECALGDIPNSYGKDKSYVFKGPEAYVNILKEGSVEAVNIANNMSTSFGSKGYTRTRSTLRKAGVAYSGHYPGEYSLVTVKGVRVALVGIQTPASSSTIGKRVRSARKDLNADVVIMSFHFSDTPQFEYTIKSSMVSQAHAAINAGADLVLGTSSHNLSGIEVYKGKNIVYGLANLTVTNSDTYRRVFVYRQTLLVDPLTKSVEAEIPYVYPATVTSNPPAAKPANTINNFQPTLHEKGGAEYNATLNMIRKYSRFGGIVPAEFIGG